MSEERWLLDVVQRRWTSISSRYGEHAWSCALDLARGGVVRLRCAVDEHLALGPPQGWVLTEAWEARRVDAARFRGLERAEWRQRADAAAAAVRQRCPELAHALAATSPSSPTTPVLVFAAEDLAEGTVHDGPRAFSQAHFEHTKARDDVAHVLAEAGVPDEVLVELGIRRSPRLGVGGPVTAKVAGGELPLGALDGPVLLRTDQPGLSLALTRTVPLIIVENLQAAETLADQRLDIAVIYTAGLPSQPALRLMAEVAADATRVLLVPDADLGGVRISEAVVGVVPAAAVVDVGELPHPLRNAWPADGVSVGGLRAAIHGRAGSLASACLARGYPVEQELAIVEAVKGALLSPHEFNHADSSQKGGA